MHSSSSCYTLDEEGVEGHRSTEAHAEGDAGDGGLQHGAEVAARLEELVVPIGVLGPTCAGAVLRSAFKLSDEVLDALLVAREAALDLLRFLDRAALLEAVAGGEGGEVVGLGHLQHQGGCRRLTAAFHAMHLLCAKSGGGPAPAGRIHLSARGPLREAPSDDGAPGNQERRRQQPNR
eukprot:CAMPEP_0177572562 /NCGR_PEP_ID=MMETSP0369-20130122/78030_1 /TAXON_ID=447022 ORGANISM="Scrippsiella hangoei-like, Strain SHHI-4" /NCGR_SAMPLE_ID=MMETSP0369 /ASSEMBLY_ACC=CAM_ASM_000364 /LENGTH=177 /DNA_ID=CAMNT_0019060555 /DNA_START=419 /DNA_END=947 /DNA_ORIENTATION=+